jgi:uncharacterized protein YqeY
MSLTDTLAADLVRAMKAKDATTLTALRMLKTALTNKSIEKSRALDAAEELQVVNALVKQRRDSIEQFEAAGRHELAAKEKAEIAVLDAYLPPSATDEELTAAVDAAVTATGAASAKDMGKVMKAVMSALAGKTVDGKRVNELVRAKLS